MKTNKRAKRVFVDAPDHLRCRATVTLKDGSTAQCGRQSKDKGFCHQHSTSAKAILPVSDLLERIIADATEIEKRLLDAPVSLIDSASEPKVYGLIRVAKSKAEEARELWN